MVEIALKNMVGPLSLTGPRPNVASMLIPRVPQVAIVSARLGHSSYPEIWKSDFGLLGTPGNIWEHLGTPLGTPPRLKIDDLGELEWSNRTERVVLVV
mgnify:CR=1 FL=1